MLSDEERKAIESFKEEINNDLSRFEYFNSYTQFKVKRDKIIIDLIEKQSKEIEHQKEKRDNQKKELAILNEKQKEFNKLLNTVNSYKGQFKRQEKEIEELKDMKKELTERVLRLESDKFWDNVVSKDKIKAKIEEYDDKGMTVNLASRSAGKTFQQAVHYEVKKVLQSLLEKE